eukprot:TRINITY_DN1984_c0_g1_i1.p1 TRINITY_DN1984_c0_g1~~TRINITY_DN1984_c0_g1_i1.p1  ORF type:complete len:268 (+),score=51.29 TRINITY_DN1984_c0_g1_i1:163-966(+)
MCIRDRYYDDDKEALHREKVKEAEKTHGLSQQENIRQNAPTVHLAEGNLYDPISCHPKNENAIKQLHRLEQGKIVATQSKMEHVGEFLETQDKLQELKNARAMNRAKWKRFESDHSHGYDIVSNAPHFGRGAKETFLPKARPDTTMWETINEEALRDLHAQPLTDTSTPLVGPAAGGSVPPIRTTVMTTPLDPTSSRTDNSIKHITVSQPGSSGRSSRQGSSRSSRQASSRQVSQASSRQASSREVSASGRVRTGGFQHLTANREEE